MFNHAKAIGSGVADGAHRLFRTKNVDKHVGTVRAAMKGSNSPQGLLVKGQVLAIFSGYMAYKISPVGMAQNAANALRRGFRGYHDVRSKQFQDAMEEVLADLPDDAKDAIRKATLNSAMDDDTPIVVGPMTEDRVRKRATSIGGGSGIYF